MTQNPPGTPPLLIKAADTPVPGTPGTNPPDPGTSVTTFEGTVTLEVAHQKYTLTGTLGDHIIVEYHASFDDSFSLGPISSFAIEIADQFGFSGFDKYMAEALQEVNKLPLVGTVTNAVLTASARITDLEINTLTGTYGIGLALDFSTSTKSISLFGVTLVALGFKVTRTKTAAPPQQP